MKKRSFIALTGAALISLAGCSAPATAPVAGSDADTPQARYDSVIDLRDAFVEAGGDCPDFKQTNRVTYAAESANCSSETVLSTYLSAEATQKRVDESKKAFGSLDSSTWLVGENWIVNAPNPESLQDELGGQLISWGDTTELDFGENKFKNEILDDPQGFATYDVRPALEIGHKICDVYDSGEHQDVLDYLIPIAEEDYSAEQLGAILAISLDSICPENYNKFPDS